LTIITFIKEKIVKIIQSRKNCNSPAYFHYFRSQKIPNLIFESAAEKSKSLPTLRNVKIQKNVAHQPNKYVMLSKIALVAAAAAQKKIITSSISRCINYKIIRALITHGVNRKHKLYENFPSLSRTHSLTLSLSHFS
jgi:hypothetical protein